MLSQPATAKRDAKSAPKRLSRRELVFAIEIHPSMNQESPAYRLDRPPPVIVRLRREIDMQIGDDGPILNSSGASTKRR